MRALHLLLSCCTCEMLAKMKVLDTEDETHVAPGNNSGGIEVAIQLPCNKN